MRRVRVQSLSVSLSSTFAGSCCTAASDSAFACRTLETIESKKSSSSRAAHSAARADAAAEAAGDATAGVLGAGLGVRAGRCFRRWASSMACIAAAVAVLVVRCAPASSRPQQPTASRATAPRNSRSPSPPEPPVNHNIAAVLRRMQPR